MAGIIVQLGEQDILNCYFRGAALPTGFQLLLCDYEVGPGDTLATLVGEPVGNGYVRQTLTPDTVGWPTVALSGGSYMATSAPVTFNATGGTWGPVITCCLATLGLVVPNGLTLTVEGLTGASTYEYVVTALSEYGETLGSTPVQVVNANANLSSYDSIELDWNNVASAVAYNVYRTASNGSGTSSSTGQIATVTSSTYTDTGVTASSISPPLVDTSGKLIDAYALDDPTTLNDGESMNVTVNFSIGS